MFVNYEKIIEFLPDILSEFGIKYNKYPNRISCSCPIHDGDKRDGVSIFTTGNSSVGNWKCWSNHCEENYGRNIIGFVHGLLETQLQEKIDKAGTIKWLESFTKTSFYEEPPPDWKIKRNNIQIGDALSKTILNEVGIDRNLVRSSLIIPPKYFIERGFSKEILDRYDVGLCSNNKKQMHGRVVVPVYNDQFTQMIGCVGRTLNHKCDVCNKFHSPHEKCPTSSFDIYKSAKWINSKGFNAEHYLYNYWFAQDFIKLSHTVILTEGQGDVWKLEEAGIKIGLGIFGSSLTDHQALKLETSGAINVIIATDNDPAGIEARYKLTEQLSRGYNVIPCILPAMIKDVGDMSIEQIKETFIPILDKLVRNNECKIF